MFFDNALLSETDAETIGFYCRLSAETYGFGNFRKTSKLSESFSIPYASWIVDLSNDIPRMNNRHIVYGSLFIDLILRNLFQHQYRLAVIGINDIYNPIYRLRIPPAICRRSSRCADTIYNKIIDLYWFCFFLYLHIQNKF